MCTQLLAADARQESILANFISVRRRSSGKHVTFRRQRMIKQLEDEQPSLVNDALDWNIGMDREYSLFSLDRCHSYPYVRMTTVTGLKLSLVILILG